MTLALGVSGATTMFTLLSALEASMQPLGIDAARIGRIVWIPRESAVRNPLTAEEYAEVKTDLQAGARLESVAAWTDKRLVMGGAGGPSVSVMQVSTDFFGTLGFRPVAGRLFAPDDALPGNPRVVVVREGARSRFGIDIGRIVRLGGADYTVVGVLPDHCWYPAAGTDFWIALTIGYDGVPAVRIVNVVACIASYGAPNPDLARSQLLTIGARLAQTAPDASARSRRLSFITLKADVTKRLGFGLAGPLGPAVVVGGSRSNPGRGCDKCR